jgi:hypothetical protein
MKLIRARCIASITAGKLRMSSSLVSQELSPVKPLPPNLHLASLPVRQEKRIRITRDRNTPIEKQLLQDPVALQRRVEKKLRYESKSQGTGRLTKDGAPLLSDLLKKAELRGDYKEAAEACERRLHSRKKIDRRIVTTMIRTFGNAGEIDKAVNGMIVSKFFHRVTN